MVLKIQGIGWKEKKNGNCKSFTVLYNIITLEINYGKALELGFLCHTFVLSITETFPLAAQEPCPRGRGYNELQSRVSLLGYLCVLPVKLTPPPPLRQTKKKKIRK